MCSSFLSNLSTAINDNVNFLDTGSGIFPRNRSKRIYKLSTETWAFNRVLIIKWETQYFFMPRSLLNRIIKYNVCHVIRKQHVGFVIKQETYIMTNLLLISILSLLCLIASIFRKLEGSVNCFVCWWQSCSGNCLNFLISSNNFSYLVLVTFLHFKWKYTIKVYVSSFINSHVYENICLQKPLNKRHIWQYLVNHFMKE